MNTRVRLLKDIQIKCIRELKTADVDGDGINETFCNFAVQRVCNKVAGYTKLSGMLANEMFDFMIESEEWELVPTSEASKWAKLGRIVVAIKHYKRHCHTASIYPTESQYSGSWQKDVPMCANVGGTNGVMKVSEAFPVKDGEPFYFILNETT